MDNTEKSEELSGLVTLVERIDYLDDEEDDFNPPTNPKTPHTFRYCITIFNKSRKTIQLLGRKWFVLQSNGKTVVVEGDKIVGQTPTLKPGQRFTYNSTHSTCCNSQAFGVFYGKDRKGNKVYTRIPFFGMFIPVEENPPMPLWGDN